MKRIITNMLVAFLIAIAFASCSSTEYTVRTRPAHPAYARPNAPGSNYVWVNGNWVWRGSAYEWNNGYWAEPRPGRWHDGRWQRVRGGWTWRQGGWR